MRKSILQIVFFFISALSAVGQSEYSLNELDSLAFDALENNKKNVAQIANQLLKAAEKDNSTLHQINAYTILGILNKNKGHYITAVDFYKNALEVAEKSNDQGRISACYNNIGTVYQIQENYSKALEYFKKSLALEETLNNPLQKSIRLYNIGDIYREMDSLSLALSYFSSSLILEKEFNNNEGIIYALLGMADIYLHLDKLTDAEIVLNEASEYAKESNVEVKVLYHLTEAELYFQENRLDNALKAITTAKDISDQHQFKVYLVDIYEKELKIKQALEESKENIPKNEANKGSAAIWIIIISIVILFSFVLFYVFNRRKTDTLITEIAQKEKSVNSMFKLANDSGKVLFEIPMSSIIWFEANDNYVSIYYFTEEEKLQKSMQRASMKNIEELISIPGTTFFRVHKSHIINKNFIEKIDGKAQAHKLKLQLIDNYIPVSRSFDIEQIKG